MSVHHHHTLQQNLEDTVKYFSIVDTRFLMFRDLVDIIKKYVKGKKTLDYGCGPATTALHLKSLGLGLNVDGVDICETTIEYAKKQDPNGQYYVIKNGRVPIEDCYYDLIFVSLVFGHIETKQELLNVFKEFARLLKIGGTVIIMEMNKESYENSNYLTFHTMFEENKNLETGSKVKIQLKVKDITGIHCFYTDEDFLNSMSNAGLTFLEMHKPLGKESDGYAWLDETSKPPCTIYVAQKEKV